MESEKGDMIRFQCGGVANAIRGEDRPNVETPLYALRQMERHGAALRFIVTPSPWSSPNASKSRSKLPPDAAAAGIVAADLRSDRQSTAGGRGGCFGVRDLTRTARAHASA